MIENISVAIVVAAVAVFVGVRFYKTLSGKSGCGCCGNNKGAACCGCRIPSKDEKTPLISK